MKCPACGATLKKISRKCVDCGAQLKKNSDGSLSQATVAVESTLTIPVAAADVPKPTPSLIAFPGVNKNALPEWRKELSERVREKHGRRAREVQPEFNATATATIDVAPQSAPTLELLPQAEVQPVNPIVSAALKRIERANSEPFAHVSAAVATAPIYEEEPIAENATEVNPEDARPAEKTHNLAVVPNPAPIEETPEVIRRPKRLIVETDPALNYLDTIPTALLVERRNIVSASTTRRLIAAIFDLAIVFALSSPLLVLDPVTSFDWQNWRTIAFSIGSFLSVGFLYLTIVTAFTGRTLGMGLCSLRVVDARNGLIPTGSQSAGRAFIYLISLGSAGVLSLYLFIDRERQTLHDRFTHTAVIRA